MAASGTRLRHGHPRGPLDHAAPPRMPRRGMSAQSRSPASPHHGRTDSARHHPTTLTTTRRTQPTLGVDTMRFDETDSTITRQKQYAAMGFQAWLNAPMNRIWIPSGILTAVAMPSQLGRDLRNHLITYGSTARTVIAERISDEPPRSRFGDRWVWLTTPSQSDCTLPEHLSELGIEIIPRTESITLPSPHEERADIRWWIAEPVSNVLPSLTYLLDHISTYVTTIRYKNHHPSEAKAIQ